MWHIDQNMTGINYDIAETLKIIGGGRLSQAKIAKKLVRSYE